MSDYKPITISDDEIAGLIKAGFLEKDPEDVFTKNLIDMHANIVFASEPLILPSLQKEQELVTKLQKKFIKTPNFKWLFGGLGAVIVIGIIALVYNIQAPETEKVITRLSAPQVVVENENTATLNPTITSNEPTEKNAIQILSAVEIKKDTLEIETAPVPSNDPRPEEPAQQFYPVPAKKEETEKLFQKTKQDHKVVNDTFDGIKRIEVNASFCDINIKTISGDKVFASGKLGFNFKGLVLRKPEYRIAYEKKDSVLKVTIENKNKTPILIAGTTSFESVLNFDVPQKTVVVIKSSGGNIKADGLNGSTCHIESSYGDITANDFAANTYIYSGSGDIAVNALKGTLRCEAHYGDVALTDITGNVRLTSSSGNINILRTVGNMTLSCGYGDVHINTLSGDLMATSSSGNVDINGLNANKCLLNTSYGNIKIQETISPLNIHSASGDVVFKKIRGDIIVGSSHGNLYFHDITGKINSSSSSGEIHVDILKGDAVIGSKYGDINLNDCLGNITLNSSSGNITGNNVELLKHLSIKSSYGDIRMKIKNKASDISFYLTSPTGDLRIRKDGLNLNGRGKLSNGSGDITITTETQSGNQLFD